jgi:hypothetical protein
MPGCIWAPPSRDAQKGTSSTPVGVMNRPLTANMRQCSIFEYTAAIYGALRYFIRYISCLKINDLEEHDNTSKASMHNMILCFHSRRARFELGRHSTPGTSGGAQARG